jgi:acyl-CoA thioesterase
VSDPSYTEVLAAVALRGNRGTAEIPPGWSQGRATFGGLVVALALQALRERVPVERRLRGLQTAFVGPLGPGEVAIRVRELRHGGSASQLQAELSQAGEVGCVVLASFGSDRPSRLALAAPPRPAAPPPESLPALAAPPGIVPEFTRHFDYRFATRTLPYTGTGDGTLTGWCRFRHALEPAGPGHVVSLVDCWPAPIVSVLSEPAPVSSLIWGLELVDPDPGARADGWWLFQGATDAARGGYAHWHAALWDPAGRLAALSRQTAAVFW